MSLLLVLVMMMSTFSGCIISDDTEEDISMIDLTIALPVSKSSPNWDAWLELIKTWKQDLKDFNHVNLSVVSVPTDEAGQKEFIKKVKKGEVSCFLGASGEMINQLIQEEAIMKMSVVLSEFVALMDEIPAGHQMLAFEEDSAAWMLPVYGTYQGVFYNTEIFKANNISAPKTWDDLMAAIGTLKTAGVTPFAAGFADEGLSYMIDELILSEGGTADHSYQPSHGVVSGWKTTVTNMKELEAAGAFTPDCYNVSFETAKDDFLSGKAAMIVAPASVFEGELDEDNVAFMGLPSTRTGRREANAYVGDVNHGIYISSDAYQQKNTRYKETMVELMGSYYFGSEAFYELLADESTFCANAAESSGDSTLEESVYKILDNSAAADLPMSVNLKTFDNLVDSYRKIFKDNADVDATLLAAANAEIEANK